MSLIVPEDVMALWNENAVAVERRVGETVIIGEGSLAALVTALQYLSARALSNVRVSLPDRQVHPFSFDGQGLIELIKDPKRPKATPSKLLPSIVA
jgi:hypothetical protein